MSIQVILVSSCCLMSTATGTLTWRRHPLCWPQVSWGLVSGQYTASSSATTTTYARSDMCGAPANGTGTRKKLALTTRRCCMLAGKREL